MDIIEAPTIDGNGQSPSSIVCAELHPCPIEAIDNPALPSRSLTVDINGGGPSSTSAGQSTPCLQATFSPSVVRPYPKSGPRIQKKSGNQHQHSAEVTSTPEKKKLLQAKKNVKKNLVLGERIREICHKNQSVVVQ